MLRTVVIAPDSFKGTLGADRVARAIRLGWLDARPGDHVILLPQADGGEGTLDAVAGAVPGARRRAAGLVTGPDGRPVSAEWLELPDGTAVVELAVSSGIALMRHPDPMGATTRGLGEVLRAVLATGPRRVLIGLGGSASTDVGTGALAALGLRLLDARGTPVGDGGGALAAIARVDSSRLPRPAAPVTLLTDVTSPLFGPYGAAAVFGPQKGASAAQVAELEYALAHVARLLGGDPDAAGAGAAGGTAYGLASVWGAAIASGSDFVAEVTGVPAALASADILITGEGRVDASTAAGKVVGGLLGRAASAGVVTAVVAGQLAVQPAGWATSLSALAGSTDAAIAEPERWLRVAGAHAARDLG